MSIVIIKERSVFKKSLSKSSHLRSLAASIVGNLLEWYDWTIYTVTSVYIAAAMFNKDDPTSALLNTLAVFAVGFVSRPIGGFFFGPLAEKIGRRKVMIITMLLMAGASFTIGLLPSFTSIGYWSSALLVLARLIQGFAHGGETATSYAYIAEIA
ncbi:MAG: MFS transporter, partial [Pluralibacter gergoviae]|nr:MFS transporter [Pluralibacter gergoviae]